MYGQWLGDGVLDRQVRLPFRRIPFHRAGTLANAGFVHFASGNRGNKICVVPSRAIVVAITSSAYSQLHRHKRSPGILLKVLPASHPTLTSTVPVHFRALSQRPFEMSDRFGSSASQALSEISLFWQVGDVDGLVCQ